MAWYDTAPIPPPEAVRRLGDVLEARGTPLCEVILNGERKEYRPYGAITSIGKIGVSAGVDGWHVFFCPPGTRRYMNLWDWKECALGEPRPKGRELPLEESVEWVLGLLERNRPPEVDLECVERSGRELDRRVARDRWLRPLLMLVSFLVVLGMLVASVIFNSMSGMVIGSLALVRMALAAVEIVKGKVSRRKK